MDSLWIKRLSILFQKNLLLKMWEKTTLIVGILMILVGFIFTLQFRNQAEIDHNPAIASRPFTLILPDFVTYSNLTYELVYVPSESDVAKHITEMVIKDLKYNFKVQGFISETYFENYVRSRNNPNPVLAAIIFDHNFKSNDENLPLKVKYHLRFRKFDLPAFRHTPEGKVMTDWDTAFLFPTIFFEDNRDPVDVDGGEPGYIREGFLTLQHSLDKAIMIHHAGEAAKQMFNRTKISVKRFPQPEYDSDEFLKSFMLMFPCVALLMFAQVSLAVVGTVMLEKEKRLKVTSFSL